MAEAATEMRLRTVEAALQVQEDILTEIQAELIEADRLTSSVERLGIGADALSQALLQVDRNQQTLTRLGRELEQVKETAVEKTVVDAKHAELKHKLEKVRRSRALILWAIGGVLVLGGLLGGFLHEQQQQDAYENCLRGQKTLLGVTAYLKTVADNSTNPAIRDSAASLLKQFAEAPREECVAD